MSPPDGSGAFVGPLCREVRRLDWNVPRGRVPSDWSLILEEVDCGCSGIMVAVHLEHDGGQRVPLGPNIHHRTEVEQEATRLAKAIDA